MKKSTLIVLSLLSILTLSSCYTQRVMVQKGAKVNSEQPTYEESQAFFVRGIAQTKVLDAQQACGGKSLVGLDVQYTVLDGLFMYITGSIYAPRTIKVYCQ